jgi:hypothetical protein
VVGHERRRGRLEGLRITRHKYVALEDGTAQPGSTTYDRICELCGWPDAGEQAAATEYAEKG